MARYASEPVTPSEFKPWPEFVADMQWRQGEHLTAVGPTGSGKTTLTNNLLEKRRFVIFAATKKRDPTVDWLKKNQGFRVVNRIEQLHPQVHNRFIYKPSFPDVGARGLRDQHAEFFRELLNHVFVNGNWTLDLDEVRYLTEFLGLTQEYELLLLQGRSLGVTVLSKTQRPKRIPLTAFDQATHLFFWKDNDEENLKRIASLGAAHDARAIRAEVARLPHHEVLYLNTATGEKVRTKVDTKER